MNTEFSEFQFAYSINREIEDRVIYSNYQFGAPFMPNQVREAKLGFDVAFKGPIKALFIQYKIPTKLTRSSANEWDDFNSEYFRIEIYPDNYSHQHNRLCELANDLRNMVFYCAPAFTEEDELFRLHKNREVSQNSAFINVHDLERINGDENHVIAYQIIPACKSIMYSEPNYSKVFSGWNQVLEFSVNHVYSDMKEFIYNFYEYVIEGRDNIEYEPSIERIGDLLALNSTQLLLIK